MRQQVSAVLGRAGSGRPTPSLLEWVCFDCSLLGVCFLAEMPKQQTAAQEGCREPAIMLAQLTSPLRVPPVTAGHRLAGNHLEPRGTASHSRRHQELPWVWLWAAPVGESVTASQNKDRHPSARYQHPALHVPGVLSAERQLTPRRRRSSGLQAEALQGHFQWSKLQALALWTPCLSPHSSNCLVYPYPPPPAPERAATGSHTR